ncbi:MAG: polyprenyl synthetase family protein [Sporolactobacillus sp.]
MDQDQISQRQRIKQTMVQQSMSCVGMQEAAKRYVSFHEKSHFRFGRLCLLHQEMYGRNDPQMYQLAAAVEWLQLSADILDDLQDKDRKTPPWMVDSPDQAATLQTTCLILALSLLEKHSHLIDHSTFFQIAIRRLFLSLQGQYQDRQNDDLTESAYLKMIAKKSGSIAAIACLSGAFASGETRDWHLIEDYSVSMGICVQLKNDLQDVASLEGKNDLFSKKKTAATLYLLEHPSDCGKQLSRYFLGELSYEQLLESQENLQKWIHHSGVSLYINTLYVKQRQIAWQAIDQLNVAESYKKQLKNFFN